MNDNSGMPDHIGAVTEVVSSYVARHDVSVADLPGLIVSVSRAFQGITTPAAEVTTEATALVPAVPVKKSVQPDFIICLEDGVKKKMLKRYLARRYNMTPEAYRARWNLPADYPMVAPNYSEKRSGLAREFGLGRKAKSDLVAA